MREAWRRWKLAWRVWWKVMRVGQIPLRKEYTEREGGPKRIKLDPSTRITLRR